MTTDPKPEKETLTAGEKDKRPVRPFVFRDWCKGCGICSAFCPRGVLERDPLGYPLVQKPENCIGCRFCELHCPDFAIMVRERSPLSEGGAP